MDNQLKIEVGRETPAERLRLWKTLLHDNFMGLECRVGADDLRGSILGRCLDDKSISVSSVSRQTLTRTPSLIKRETDEAVVIALGLGGRLVFDQGGRCAEADRGDLLVLDSSRPFEARFTSAVVGHGVLRVPKSEIARRIGGPDDAAFGTFRPDRPLQKLVAAFLQGTIALLDDVDADTLNKLFDQSLDLLALMIGRNQGSPVDPSTHRAAMRLRIKAYVRAHLTDPELTIGTAAAALGLSSRYVNALLSDEGTSFGRYLLSERLEGARRTILDPRRANRQVTEIAFDWGFNNTSHFGRTYKRKFGMTPRDAKLAGGSS